MAKINLELVQAARKSGGDKYEGDVKGETRPFSIYVPQVISRANGPTPAEKITVTIETK